MSIQLQPGQQVTVNAFGGKRPSVIVVEDRGDVVLVCNPEEFELARAEKRLPATIGMHREDVLGVSVESKRKGVSSELPSDLHRARTGD